MHHLPNPFLFCGNRLSQRRPNIFAQAQNFQLPAGRWIRLLSCTFCPPPLLLLLSWIERLTRWATIPTSQKRWEEGWRHEMAAECRSKKIKSLRTSMWEEEGSFLQRFFLPAHPPLSFSLRATWTWEQRARPTQPNPSIRHHFLIAPNPSFAHL